MKKGSSFLFWIVIWILASLLWGFQAYLYYLGPCSQVEKYWFITHTPGRCLLSPVLSAPTSTPIPEPTKAGPDSIYPISTITPGKNDSRVNQSNIKQTICLSGYTATVRPPVSVTNKIKQTVMVQYGIANAKPFYYELDHLISLELGGDPSDPKNLWPEAYQPYPGARQKDRVETWLNKQVCNGSLSLAAAQKEEVNDWYKVYLQITSSSSLGASPADSYSQSDD